MFSWTSSTLNTDFLLPALEQYERPVGPDPQWKDKKYNKAVWRGSTTGSDLTIPHARKHSQRVRLARRKFKSRGAPIVVLLLTELGTFVRHS